MTVPATAQPFTKQLPSDLEKSVADHLRTAIAQSMSENDGETTLYVRECGEDQPEPITLTPLISSVMLELLRHLAKGETVTLIPMGEMMTTQQAADVLNVSRPHLIKLLEQDNIRYDKVGRHRRIRAVDIFEYKNARDARRSNALDELGELDADLI